MQFDAEFCDILSTSNEWIVQMFYVVKYLFE